MGSGAESEEEDPDADLGSEIEPEEEEAEIEAEGKEESEEDDPYLSSLNGMSRLDARLIYRIFSVVIFIKVNATETVSTSSVCTRSFSHPSSF